MKQPGLALLVTSVVTFYATTTPTTTPTNTTIHNVEVIGGWYVASPDTMEVALWFAGREILASQTIYM
jgi:hypothetical protein